MKSLPFHRILVRSTFIVQGVEYMKVDGRHGMTAKGERVRFADFLMVNVKLS